MKPSTSGGITGAASSPHNPLNTTRLITRGLVSARKSRQSAGSAAVCGISMAGIAAPIRAWAGTEKPHSPPSKGRGDGVGAGERAQCPREGFFRGIEPLQKHPPPTPPLQGGEC